MEVRVEIAIYDLLPASRLSTSLWYIGCGLYHTAVRIPELQVEYAYGGLLPTLSATSSRDDSRRDMTGIFSVPSPENGRAVERLMPGLRFVQRIDVGNVHILGNNSRQGSGSEGYDKPLPSVPSLNNRYSRLTREGSSTSSLSNAPLLRSTSSYGPSLDHESILDQSFTADEWGRKQDEDVSSPISYDASPFSGKDSRHVLQQVLAVIEAMKKAPDWKAIRYSLLSKNCNHFTDELCLRLTGRNAPPWINRAAWLGQSLPCLVPQDWLEPPTPDELYDPPSSPARHCSTANRTDQPAQEGERPLSPLIAVPYIETRPLHIEVDYAGTRQTTTQDS